MPGMMSLMMKVMSRMMPTCGEVSLLTSRAMDEELSIKERLGIKTHLLVCKWCRRYASQLHQIREIIHHHTSESQIESDKTSSGLTTAAQDRLNRAIRDSQKDSN